MKRVIVLLALGFFFSQTLAQGQNRVYVFDNNGTVWDRGQSVQADAQTGLDPACLDVPSRDARNITDHIDGYPFLVSGWGAGRIFTNEQILSCEKINFFLHNRQMWVKMDGDVHSLEPHESIQAVEIGEKRLVAKVVQKYGDTPCWVEELEAGPYASVYKYYTSNYTPAIPPRNSYDTGNKASFINKGYLYVSIEDGALQELPEKTTAFLNLFPQHTAEMKQFLSQNKIKLNKEADVIKTIAYYNSL